MIIQFFLNERTNRKWKRKKSWWRDELVRTGRSFDEDRSIRCFVTCLVLWISPIRSSWRCIFLKRNDVDRRSISNDEKPSNSWIFSMAMYLADFSCSRFVCWVMISFSNFNLIAINSWYFSWNSFWVRSSWAEVFCKSWYCFFKRRLLSNSILHFSFASFNWNRNETKRWNFVFFALAERSNSPVVRDYWSSPSIRDSSRPFDFSFVVHCPKDVEVLLNFVPMLDDFPILTRIFVEPSENDRSLEKKKTSRCIALLCFLWPEQRSSVPVHKIYYSELFHLDISHLVLRVNV